jgi:3',5'-cyclic AMP phosphodiesterase CpdA
MHRQAKWTRRQMLRLGATALLAAECWPGALCAEGDGHPGDFYFAVVNDIHYLNHRCGRWLERVVEQLKAHKEGIAFCLVVGDLAEDGQPAQLRPVRDHLKDLGVPTHVVIGNHDYRTQEDRKPYEDLFPDRLNYHFEHGGWQFVGLDTTDGQRAKGVAAPAATLRWLDATLPKLDKRKPTVVFTHLPLGPWVIYRLTNADDVLAYFKEYNLQAVFNGHFHAFTERRLGQTILTTNRCCSFSRENHVGPKEKGYFLCHAHDGKVERTFVEVKPA